MITSPRSISGIFSGDGIPPQVPMIRPTRPTYRFSANTQGLLLRYFCRLQLVHECHSMRTCPAGRIRVRVIFRLVIAVPGINENSCDSSRLYRQSSKNGNLEFTKAIKLARRYSIVWLLTWFDENIVLQISTLWGYSLFFWVTVQVWWVSQMSASLGF